MINYNNNIKLNGLKKKIINVFVGGFLASLRSCSCVMVGSTMTPSALCFQRPCAQPPILLTPVPICILNLLSKVTVNTFKNCY